MKTYMKKKQALIHLKRDSEEDYLNYLMDKWERESKQSNTSQAKKINAMEDKVEQAWNSYQDITTRL